METHANSGTLGSSACTFKERNNIKSLHKQNIYQQFGGGMAPVAPLATPLVQHHMNDRECLRTSTNVWRSCCDHCELVANCIRKPIRHTFAMGETSITFETPQKRPRMLTNSYECLAIICDHYEFMANCIRKLIRHIFAAV